MIADGGSRALQCASAAQALREGMVRVLKLLTHHTKDTVNIPFIFFFSKVRANARPLLLDEIHSELVLNTSAA
ncbi:unnamed protein product [Ixodes persulcatus]